MIPSEHFTWTAAARWVFSVDRPPIERGVIVVQNGRIAAVEERGGREPDVDFGDCALLPGLVNAHTHLDLSGLRGHLPAPASFVDWLRAVIDYRRRLTLDRIEADIRMAVEETLSCGVTLVGDISGEGLSWSALSAAPLRAVVFYEILGLPKLRAKQAWSEVCLWLASHQATETCRPGLSPHAPYSVRRSLFRCAAGRAARAELPLSVHLAETPEETELLETLTGPLVAFLKELGVWDANGLSNLNELINIHRDVHHVAFAHGNYLGLQLLPPNNSIVYCPRTHAFFGHPSHPFADLLKRGVNVALGTDSLASNPDLDILAELRFLSERRPDVDGPTLLRMATLNGAKALGWDNETGSLTPGKSADFVVVPLPARKEADPYRWAFYSTGARMTFFRGKDVTPRISGS